MDEISELQREWRRIILDKLTTIEQSQKELVSDISRIKSSIVKQEALDALRELDRQELTAVKDKIDKLNVADFVVIKDKVEKLENFKYKLVGICIGAQGVLLILAWFIENLVIHK